MDKARNFQQHEHVAMMGKIILFTTLNDIKGFQDLQVEQLKRGQGQQCLLLRSQLILMQGLIEVSDKPVSWRGKRI